MAHVPGHSPARSPACRGRPPPNTRLKASAQFQVPFPPLLRCTRHLSLSPLRGPTDETTPISYEGRSRGEREGVRNVAPTPAEQTRNSQRTEKPGGLLSHLVHHHHLRQHHPSYDAHARFRGAKARARTRRSRRAIKKWPPKCRRSLPPNRSYELWVGQHRLSERRKLRRQWLRQAALLPVLGPVQ